MFAGFVLENGARLRRVRREVRGTGLPRLCEPVLFVFAEKARRERNRLVARRRYEETKVLMIS